MTQEEKKSMQEKVLSAIEGGKIKQRPKWQFALESALLTVGVVITVVVLLFLVSFVVFMLRQKGVWFLPAFGVPGVVSLFTHLPWLFILLAIVFVVVLETLFRRYEFGYKKPMLYSFLGLVVLVVGGGAVVSAFHLHEGLLNRANQHRLPGGTMFYKKFSRPDLDDVTPGIIQLKVDSGFQMRGLKEDQGEIFMVVITPETRLPLGADFIEGDSVVVMGQKDDNTIKAWGIRKIEPRKQPYPIPMPAPQMNP